MRECAMNDMNKSPWPGSKGLIPVTGDRADNANPYNRAYLDNIYLMADEQSDHDLIDDLKSLRLPLISPREKIASTHAYLSCDIKKLIDETLHDVKTLLVVINEKTVDDVHGGCENCDSYNPWFRYCGRNLSHSRQIDYNDFLDYGCKQAIHQKCHIVILYDSDIVHRDWCPPLLKNRGTHIAAYLPDKKQKLNTSAIKQALTDA